MQLFTRAPRQRQPEQRTLTRDTPRLQPATMQPGVLTGDRQAEASAAGGACPRRVGPPEAVEHQGRLARLQADSVVANADSDRVAVRTHPDDDVGALAVLDRVDEQVAQDSFDTPGVHLGSDRSRRRLDPHRATTTLRQRFTALHDPVDERAYVGRLGLQYDGPGVVTADLEQISEQSLEPVQLCLQQLSRPGDRRIEAGAVLVQQIGSHAHGRQRRT